MYSASVLVARVSVHRKMREHQAAARPARITAKIRIDDSAVLLRRVVSCSRVLLNASRVNINVSRGSSVNRDAKLHTAGELRAMNMATREIFVFLSRFL